MVGCGVCVVGWWVVGTGHSWEVFLTSTVHVKGGPNEMQQNEGG